MTESRLNQLRKLLNQRSLYSMPNHQVSQRNLCSVQQLVPLTNQNKRVSLLHRRQNHRKASLVKAKSCLRMISPSQLISLKEVYLIRLARLSLEVFLDPAVHQVQLQVSLEPRQLKKRSHRSMFRST